MPLLIEVSSPRDSRPCRFSLCLQGGSVFADFDVGDEGRVFLRRISFDGYGCCDAPDTIGRMPVDHSRTLINGIDHGSLAEPGIESILRTYFRKNADALWEDALSDHGLI